MNFKIFFNLGLLFSITACGDQSTSSNPPGLPPKIKPQNVIAPVGALDPSASNTPTPPADKTPTTLSPTVSPTDQGPGMELIASLANQTWKTCYSGNHTIDNVKVDVGVQRILTFIKGSNNTVDSYTTQQIKFANVDCSESKIIDTGSVWTQNQLTARVWTENPEWIEVKAEKCEGGGCKPTRSLIKLPTDSAGLVEAGEKSKEPGSFFTETPRVYILAK